MKELKIGAREELVYIVQDDDLASALSTDKDDAFPTVFATSRMVALMELTAARLMKPILANEELSVGVNVNISQTNQVDRGAQYRDPSSPALMGSPAIRRINLLVSSKAFTPLFTSASISALSALSARSVTPTASRYNPSVAG